MTPQVLLIEDDDAMRISLTQTMDLEGITVVSANGLAQARRAIRANFAGIILSDIRMPTDDGFAVLAHVQSVDSELPVVMLTGEADVPMALRAMKDGAYDFLEKPCPSDKLLKVVARALGYRDVVLQKRRLEREVKRSDPAAVNFPGTSNTSKTLQTNLRRLGPDQGHVYISGGPGVGKKLAAYTLHALGREDAQFVGFNLNQVGTPLADVILPSGNVDFSVKSAHLATPDDLAFLSEQVALHPNLRILMSGQQSLTQCRSAHAFYKDIAFSELSIPTLRARRQDLPIIFEQTLRHLVRTQNMDMPEVAEGIYAQIIAQDWEGNLTELRAFAQNVLTGSAMSPLKQGHLTLAQQLDDFETLVLRETLRETKGSATQAAQQLGMPRKTFYDRLTRYNIKPKDFK